ncbi:hypothetical protein [Sphingobium sp. RAC03]|uniref:hypothetical protein n=1 Tax=Sphingobium sp. RAC03 TaxID=1843368 RepID=UPI00083DD989|nr:hypothetical protein [Sphingobium sp. RAC03]AOF97966.1 hypothetical protein BSY17_1532 [Sphingobium sp. RAC03]
MQDPYLYLAMALTTLAGVAIIAVAALRGWDGWLALKRAELNRRAEDAAPPSAVARIEVADLKERIRKLEAIAAGVDL